MTEERALIYVQGTESSGPEAFFLDPRTGSPVGAPILGDIDGFFVEWSPTLSPDSSVVAMGFAKNDERTGEVVLADLDTGAVLNRIDTPECCPTITFDSATGDLALGYGDGRISTVDPVSGETMTDVRLGLVRGPLDIEVRPDGLLTVVTASNIMLVDRSAGRIGAPLPLQNVEEAHIRADGLVVTVNNKGQIEVFDPSASALIREIDVDPLGRVGFDDGRAAIKSQFGEAVELVDLATGSRSQLELRTPDGELFAAGVVYPEPDGAWAISTDLVLARWEGEDMVESVRLGSTEDVVGIPYGPKPAGTRFGDLYAVVGLRPDGSTEATLVTTPSRSWSGDLTYVPAFDGPGGNSLYVPRAAPVSGAVTYAPVFDSPGGNSMRIPSNASSVDTATYTPAYESPGGNSMRIPSIDQTGE